MAKKRMNTREFLSLYGSLPEDEKVKKPKKKKVAPKPKPKKVKKVVKKVKPKAIKKPVRKVVKKSKPKVVKRAKPKVVKKVQRKPVKKFAVVKRKLKGVKRKPLVRLSKDKKGPISRNFAIASLLLNLMLPGFGTIIGKRAKKGSSQLLVWGVSLMVGIFLGMGSLEFPSALGGIVAIIGAAVAWVWALFSSIDLLKNSK